MTDQPPRSPGKLGTLCGLAVVACATTWLGCAGGLDPQVRAAWEANQADGGGGGGTGGTVQVCRAPETILSTNRCALAGCHSATNPSGNLNLTMPTIVAQLLGRMPDGTLGSMCAGSTKAYLIAGAGPADGLLLDKMFMTTPPCGQRMPVGVYLNATEEACVREWATAVTNGQITQ